MKKKPVFWTVSAVLLALGLVLAGCGDSGDPTSPPPSKVATPVASPASETAVGSGTQITLISDTGAAIYYTTDGSTPTTSSTLYTEGTKPAITTSPTTIKAIAVKSGMTNSDVMSETYTINTNIVAIPTASPAAGQILSGKTVTLTSTTDSAAIHYTVDGTTPTTDSPTYSTPIAISADTTIKAIAVKNGMTTSAEMTAVYTVVSVSGVTVSAAGNAPSVVQGTTLQFNAAVTGTNGPNQSVTWTITTSGVKAATTISTGGLLTVAADETKTSIEVKATSTVDTSKSGTKSVTVTAASPTYTGVTVSTDGNKTSVAKGGTLQFNAAVTGTNGPNQSVTWTITSGMESGTSISTSGLLTVAGNASASSITVKATSVGDSTKSGTKTVTLSAVRTLKWTAATGISTIFNSGITGVAYGGGKWVAVGKSGKMATSTNGTSWTAVDVSSIFYGNDLTCVAYGNGKWLASSDSQVATSTNGTEWTEIKTGYDNFGYLYSIGSIKGIAYGNNRWVVAGTGYSDGNGKIVTSTDGVIWTAATMEGTTFTGNNSSEIYGVAYNGTDRWVAAGEGPNTKLATSTDGINWTTADNNVIYYRANNVAYGNGKWVAVGSGGMTSVEIVISTNGTTWAKAASIPELRGAAYNSAAYGGGIWVAVGNKQQMVTSPDGNTWTGTAAEDTKFPSNDDITSVAYGGASGSERFVAVGGRYSPSTIVYSTWE